jgi:hypothetical protein
MRALLAAVQVRIALGTDTVEIGVWRQGRRTIEASGRRHVLDQAGEAWSGYIDRWPGALRLWPVVARASGIAFRIHVPRLSVLAVAVHGESKLRFLWSEREPLLESGNPARSPVRDPVRHAGRYRVPSGRERRGNLGVTEGILREKAEPAHYFNLVYTTNSRILPVCFSNGTPLKQTRTWASEWIVEMIRTHSQSITQAAGTFRHNILFEDRYWPL